MDLNEAVKQDRRLSEIAAHAQADPEGWAFFQLKTNLNKLFSPKQAHSIFGDFLHRFETFADHKAPLLHLRDVAAASASTYLVHTPAQNVRLKGAPLCSQQRSPEFVVAARELFVAQLNAVTTYGRSNLRSIEEQVFSDLQGNEPGRYPTLWWFDPMISAKAEGEFFFHLPSSPSFRVAEAIDITGVFSMGWGHCVLEFSPQILLIEKLAQIDPNIPLIVDSGLPNQFYDHLRYVSGGKRDLIKLGFRQAAHVDRLWVASSPEFWPALRAPGTVFQANLTSINPAAVAEVLQSAPNNNAHAELLSPADPSLKRLYFARNGRDRRHQNQPEVIERLSAQGFVVVHPEQHSFAEQLDFVRNATHIAGPWGSQLMLALLYGAPNLRVLMFHAPDLEERPGITAIAEERGQKVLLVPGELEEYNKTLPYNSLYSVSPQVVDAALEEWI